MAGAGAETASLPQENRKILIVSREARFSESVVNYAVNLAERLGYDLIALNVGSGLGAERICCNRPYHYFLGEKFKKQAKKAAAQLERRLQGQEGWDLSIWCGSAKWEPRWKLSIMRKDGLNLCLNASEMSEAEMMGGVSLPVFTIKGNQGDIIMAKETTRGGKLIGKTIAYGLATAALYAAVFLNSDTIMNYFTRGGWYAALPVATVFLVSYVHGTFSHNVWEVMGIRAPQKTVQPQPKATQRPVRRQRPRPRLSLNV